MIRASTPRCAEIKSAIPLREHQHLVELGLCEGGFLARTLHFDEIAILSRDQIEIDRHGFVFFVIKIDNRVSIKNAGANSRH